MTTRPIIIIFLFYVTTFLSERHKKVYRSIKQITKISALTTPYKYKLQ